MAYHIYTTRALVLSSRPSREADRTYSILTEDLGLLHVRARGVRFEKSKLRAALEPFSMTSVSLVRGQESWRLTGATLEERLTEDTLGPVGLRAFARVFALLERLVAGEEPHPEIFARIAEGLAYCMKSKGEEHIAMLEIILVLRLLYELGYVSDTEVQKGYLESPLTAELLARGEAEKKILLNAANQGLRTSSLV